jgi:hypothetical protein
MLIAPAVAAADGIECRVIQSDPGIVEPLDRPGDHLTHLVECPSGLVLTGGGENCGEFPAVEGLILPASAYPQGDPATWRCDWANTTLELAACQCDAVCCTMSAGPSEAPVVCTHDECLVGEALEDGCNDCVATVCACDSYCCSTSWDTFCIHEAQELCGKTCNSQGSCLAACGCP